MGFPAWYSSGVEAYNVLKTLLNVVKNLQIGLSAGQARWPHYWDFLWTFCRYCGVDSRMTISSPGWGVLWCGYPGKRIQNRELIEIVLWYLPIPYIHLTLCSLTVLRWCVYPHDQSQTYNPGKKVLTMVNCKRHTVDLVSGTYPYGFPMGVPSPGTYLQQLAKSVPTLIDGEKGR